MSGFLRFTVRNHTLFIFCGFVYVLSPLCLHVRALVCLFTRVACLCVCGCCFSVGELFHVASNEIRSTPCSLLSGLYLSNRLVQVISFLWRLVRLGSAQSTRTTSCRREGKRQAETDMKRAEILRFTCTKLTLTYGHF